jgi:hypothetical protein
MLNYVPNTPAFVFAQRAALLDKDDVADTALVGRIVGHVFHPTANELPVELMAYLPFNEDNNTLIHGVADNGALPRLSGFARFTHLFSPVVGLL